MYWHGSVGTSTEGSNVLLITYVLDLEGPLREVPAEYLIGYVQEYLKIQVAGYQ